MNNGYKTNTEMQQLLHVEKLERVPFEVRPTNGHRVNFGKSVLRGFREMNFLLEPFVRGEVYDRVTGQKHTVRRNFGLLAYDGDGFAYRLHSGANGSVRYGWAKTEREAQEAVERWVQRRFVYVPKSVDKFDHSGHAFNPDDNTHEEEHNDVR